MSANQPFDELDTPPPPNGWRVAAVVVGFALAFVAFAMFLTSCTCTLDGESVARAIIIYEAGK